MITKIKFLFWLLFVFFLNKVNSAFVALYWPPQAFQQPKPPTFQERMISIITAPVTLIMIFVVINIWFFLYIFKKSKKSIK